MEDKEGRKAARMLVGKITNGDLFDLPSKWKDDVARGMDDLMLQGLIKHYNFPVTSYDVDGNFNGSVSFVPVESPKLITLDVEVKRRGITFKELDNE